MHQTKFYKILIIQYVFLTTCLSINNVYSSKCSLIEEINEVEKLLFESSINTWSHNKDFTKHCNIYIAKKYYYFFKETEDKEDLKQALSYLYYSSGQLDDSEKEYKMAFEYIIKCEASKESPDINNICKHYKDKKIPEISIDQEVYDSIKKLIKTGVDQYIQNPLHEHYPTIVHPFLEKLIEKFDIDKKESEEIKKYNTKLKDDMNHFLNKLKEKMEKMKQYVESYKDELKAIGPPQNKQSLQQVNTIINLRDKIKSLSNNSQPAELTTIKSQPDDLTIQALQTYKSYHETVNNNKESTVNNKCTNYGIAINHLNKAKKQLPFLKDFLSVKCLKELACLSKKIQDNFPDNKQKHDNYNKKLRGCRKLIKETSINKACKDCKDCKNDDLIQKQQQNIEDLIAFYEAQISLINPQGEEHPTDKLKEFMKNIESKIHSNNNTKKLYQYAGSHIAGYYYNRSKELFNNRPDNSDETLNKIGKSIEKYEKYKQFHEGEQIDIIQKYNQLKQFVGQDYDKPKSVSMEVAEDPSLTPLEEKNYIEQAEKLFDNTDYIESWNTYAKVYPFITSSLKNLYNEIYTLKCESIWLSKINSDHYKKMKILCIIMSFNLHRNDEKEHFERIINQEIKFDDAISWHIPKPQNDKKELSSDKEFFWGFLRILRSEEPHKTTIDFFLNAYKELKPLITSYSGGKDRKRIENKQKRIFFWIKNKVWPMYGERLKQEILSQKKKDFPDIFSKIVKVDKKYTMDLIKNQQNHDLLAMFETFYRNGSEVTCENIRLFDKDIFGERDQECFDNFYRKVEKTIDNNDNSFRFYFTFALIRKEQGDIINWIDNIAIAYSKITNNNRIRQESIKKELAEAKLYVNLHNIDIGPQTQNPHKRLKKNELIYLWNDKSFVRNNLIRFEKPAYAKVDLEEEILKNEVDIGNIRSFLQKLLNSFHFERENLKKQSEYMQIFLDFFNRQKNKKVTKKEIKKWHNKFFNRKY